MMNRPQFPEAEPSYTKAFTIFLQRFLRRLHLVSFWARRPLSLILLVRRYFPWSSAKTSGRRHRRKADKSARIWSHIQQASCMSRSFTFIILAQPFCPQSLGSRLGRRLIRSIAHAIWPRWYREVGSFAHIPSLTTRLSHTPRLDPRWANPIKDRVR
jgi:hypothetical protein